MPQRHLILLAIIPLALTPLLAQEKKPAREKLYLDPINVAVPSISTDKSVKYDFDIVYVRAPRAGDKVHKRFFTDFSSPVTMEPGADLMLLHPDGTEEVLVQGGEGSITDPVVSLDGKSVYYSHIHYLQKYSQWNPPKQGADIYKIHLKSRKIVRLTNQRFSPNTGAANWSADYRTPEKGKSHYEYGVYNTGPCPLPGGRLAFTSNRDGFRPAKGYPAICMQLFVMDDADIDLPADRDPPNLEKIGHLNLAGALHPVVLTDGRIMYSTLESQGARGDILWGIWTINPDGSNWNPLVSAFDTGGAPNGFHFQAQLSNGEIVVEEYYNQNNSGFGAYIKLLRPGTNPNLANYSPYVGAPLSLLDDKKQDYPLFGPAEMNDGRNAPWRYGRHSNGKPRNYRMPFMPLGSVCLTPFTHGLEGEADRSILGDKSSPCVGKVTHPSAAPDNHLLTCYSPGPVNHQYTYLPQLDGGIYLIKSGQVVNEPAEMRLIKNDPNYNECWPRAVVPYERIYKVKEPQKPAPVANDGTASKHLPKGTPFALVGTSSFYKRESYPNGSTLNSSTGHYAGGNDPWKGLDAFTSHGHGMPLNWHNQGADAGLYTNDEIHAVRILAMEPTTDRKGANSGRRYFSHAGERFRVLGEIPLRKFNGPEQPRDEDKNPDTSFLARIPADVGFTFQTLDRDGLVLNSAQTWHQLRPGEVRTNCGGCHAHSQPPTSFTKTVAAQPEYPVWDLINQTPLLSLKEKSEIKIKYDVEDKSGVRFNAKGPVTVEYWRDVKPILTRSCVTCHSAKDGQEPKGNLDLDADGELVQYEHHGKFPGTYYRLAIDEKAKFGHKPPGWDSWGYPNASRTVRKFQSRRSLLVWKIFGKRLDGFSNDDHPSEDKPGSGHLVHNGKAIDMQKEKHKFDLDYTGQMMPPADAKGVVPLSDEDRRTIVRWIDLGCPIDLEYDSQEPTRTGFGYMLDDQRPTLTLQEPQRDGAAEFSRIVVGMHDYGTGLNPKSFTVTADFEVNGIAAGENLASRFAEVNQGVWEWKLAQPQARKPGGILSISIADRQGNITRLERRY